MAQSPNLDALAAKYGGVPTPSAPDVEAIAAKYGGTVQPATPAEPKWYEPGGDMLLDNMRAIGAFGKRVAQGIWNHPVESLATAGGIAAVPLTGGTSLLPAVAAAGLGGAGGAGIGTIVKAARGDADTPQTGPAVIGEMAKQGAVQAAAEGGGRLLQGTLRVMAPRLYQSALAPTVALRREYPTVVQTGLEHAVPVSRGGLEKAAALKSASMDAADNVVADAAAQPNEARIDPRQAVSGIARAVQDVRQLPVARPQMRAIGDYGRQYLAEHPGTMSLPDAQSAVRATDRFYDPAYRATMDRGNPITSGQTAAALGINNETRNLLRALVPGLAEQNASTQALAGLEQALERRTGNMGNWMPFGMRHAINAGIGTAAGGFAGREKGLATFLALEGLNNPLTASTAAIAANQASAIPMAQLIRAAVMARLSAGRNTPMQPAAPGPQGQ